MLASLKKSFAPEHESQWFWGIALLAIFIEMCFHALLPVSISNDSYGYLWLSQNLLNPEANSERSVGYPLFLDLLGIHFFDTLTPVVLVQSAMSIATPLLIFKGVSKFGLVYAVVGALISCLYFYTFVIPLYILTEPVYAFSLVLYAFLMLRYFQSPTVPHLLQVVLSCWLIYLLRMSGFPYFLSFFGGMVVSLGLNLIAKDSALLKRNGKHALIALAVFFSIQFVYDHVTDRKTSVTWTHFVFNWMYSNFGEVHYGIIKPENGPAAQHLFDALALALSTAPDNSHLEDLKNMGSPAVQSLKPEADGKYSKKSIDILLLAVAYDIQNLGLGWGIEAALTTNTTAAERSQLLSAAIFEATQKHPEFIMQRLGYLWEHGIWFYFIHGIHGEDLTLATAYNMQIPAKIDAAPHPSLGPRLYSQWAYDLYKHTGHDPAFSQFSYPDKFPLTLGGAYRNVRADNLIGFGHFIALCGMQILRLCWALIAIGLVIFPFAPNKPVLASFLCASIVPTLLSVFLSELDYRHIMMAAPLQITAAALVIYSLTDIAKRIRGKKNAY